MSILNDSVFEKLFEVNQLIILKNICDLNNENVELKTYVDRNYFFVLFIVIHGKRNYVMALVFHPSLRVFKVSVLSLTGFYFFLDISVIN